MIDKVLVTVRDVTELRKLAVEAKQKDTELEMIDQLINIDNEKFIEIYDQALGLLESALKIIKLKSIDGESLKSIFRYLHTAKGLLRTYGLTISSSEIHDIEDSLSGLTNPSEDHESPSDSLESRLEQAIKTLGRYADINTHRLKRSHKHSAIDENSLNEVKRVITTPQRCETFRKSLH